MTFFKKRKNRKSKAREEFNARPEQVLNPKISFAVTEAYKTARTNLQFVSNDDGCNIIAFTSSFPGEGKTITCVNMSVCLAQNGKRVLLIDSDMRKPQVATTLGVKKAPGLADLLAGFVKLSDTKEGRIRQKTHIPNLDVISAGNTPPNPAELLAGNRFKELISKLSEEYDFILIDTPPTLVVTDAIVIKNNVNGYVVVVRSEVTGIDTVKETVLRLRQIDAKLCGFIVNGQKAKGRGKYSKFSRYSKYSKYTNDPQ